jgi:hypothetical protein
VLVGLNVWRIYCSIADDIKKHHLQQDLVTCMYLSYVISSEALPKGFIFLFSFFTQSVVLEYVFIINDKICILFVL